MGWEGLMLRKVGGSRGNPPCVGPCVSCHWRSARRVPAKDCIVWCAEDTAHVPSFTRSLLFFFFLILFFFPSSESSCLPQVMQRLACSNGIPTPKMRAERKRGHGRREGGMADRFENTSRKNTYLGFFSSALSLGGLQLCVCGLIAGVNQCSGGVTTTVVTSHFPLCLHTVHSARDHSCTSPVSQIPPGKLELN